MGNKNIGGKMMIKLCLLIAALVSFAVPAYASVPEISGDKLIDGILSTLLYGAIGLIMAAISFKIIDALTPGDLRKQLTEEKNMALGIVVASQALGISIIIAAAIAG